MKVWEFEYSGICFFRKLDIVISVNLFESLSLRKTNSGVHLKSGNLFDILKWTNTLISRPLRGNGLWLKADGSCLTAQCSWLMAKKNLVLGPGAWGTQRQIFLGHEPWALSHTPCAMSHGPWAMGETQCSMVPRVSMKLPQYKNRHGHKTNLQIEGATRVTIFCEKTISSLRSKRCVEIVGDDLGEFESQV